MSWLPDPFELVAVLFGIVSVYLSARQNIWSWPTAIVNVLLFAVIFFRTRLYADMGLQVIYAGISVYGWYHWLYGGAARSELQVSRITTRVALGLAAIAVAGSLALGTLLRGYTNAAIPYLDSSLSVTSLIAQWMMSRKILENWLVWIAVDLVYTPLFVYRHQAPTAVQYLIFLGLAATGYVEWRRSHRLTAAR